MSSKQRLTELRITRNGTARTRNLCGGTVVGDYIDRLTGERVLTVKVESVGVSKPKASKKDKVARPADQSLNEQVTHGA